MHRILFALLLSTMPVAAQQPRRFEPVDSGKVIRFQAGGVVVHGRMLTTLLPSSDSARFCRLPGPPCAGQVEPWQVGWVRPATLEHLEVQAGTNAGQGAKIGAIFGALLTFGAYALASSFCEYQCPSDGEVIVKSGMIGGLWGAGVGALFGSGSARMERRF